jgi:hypothetical protein
LPYSDTAGLTRACAEAAPGVIAISADTVATTPKRVGDECLFLTVEFSSDLPEPAQTVRVVATDDRRALQIV